MSLSRELKPIVEHFRKGLEEFEKFIAEGDVPSTNSAPQGCGNNWRKDHNDSWYICGEGFLCSKCQEDTPRVICQECGTDTMVQKIRTPKGKVICPKCYDENYAYPEDTKSEPLCENCDEERYKHNSDGTCGVGILGLQAHTGKFVFTPKKNVEDRESVVCKCGHEEAFHEIDNRGHCIHGLTWSAKGVVVKGGCDCKGFTIQDVSEPQEKKE